MVVSNYRSAMSLDDYCKRSGVVGLSNLDTRALTKRLRETGCLAGVVATSECKLTDAELAARAKGWTLAGKDLLSAVSCAEPYEWKDGTDAEWEFAPEALAAAAKEMNAGAGKPYSVVAYDFGVKHNILRRLASFGCKITVVPAGFPADEALALNPDGIFYSNGPGDPSAAPYAVETARSLLGRRPMFGICMGHQLMGQAFGGKTFKLKFGHHGGNHPCVSSLFERFLAGRSVPRLLSVFSLAGDGRVPLAAAPPPPPSRNHDSPRSPPRNNAIHPIHHHENAQNDQNNTTQKTTTTKQQQNKNERSATTPPARSRSPPRTTTTPSTRPPCPPASWSATSTSTTARVRE